MPNLNALTTQALLPFVPAQDYQASRAFYTELGFEQAHHDANLTGFQFGASRFYLQNFYDKGLAENLMLQLLVDDLDAWWAHLEALNLPARYSKVRLQAPETKPWGQRLLVMTDPSGVLWYVAQA